MLDELLILKKIKGGDIKAFEGLFRRYYFPLCCYAAGITGQMDVAEEIVEELFDATNGGRYVTLSAALAVRALPLLFAVTHIQQMVSL